MTLVDLLDAAEIEGLALDKQPTGYTASIFFGLDCAVGKWSDRVFASTASEAIEKALRALPVRPVLAPPPY